MKTTFLPRTDVLLRLLLGLLVWSTMLPALSEEAYKPIFSKEVLDKADSEGKIRLMELEARNRARWEKSQNAGHGEQQSGRASHRHTIYKHVDAKGHVVYGDSVPAEGGQTVDVQIKAPDQQSLSDHQRMLEDQNHALELLADQKRLQQKQQAERAENAAAHQKYLRKCAELRHEIDDYQRGGSVYYELDENGRRHYFSDQELTAKVAELETGYRQHCH